MSKVKGTYARQARERRATAKSASPQAPLPGLAPDYAERVRQARGATVQHQPDVRMSALRAVSAGPWVYALALLLLPAMSVLGHAGNPVAEAFALALALTLPGALLTSLLLPSLRGTGLRLAFSVAFSTVLWMLVGVLFSSLGTFAGVAKPLSASALLVAFPFVFVLLLALAYRCRTDPVRWLLAPASSSSLVTSLVSLSLPALAIVGALRLTAVGSSSLAIATAVLLLLTGLCLCILAFARPAWPLAPWLFSLSLAIAYSTSMRGQWLFGWDIQKEQAVAASTQSSGVFALGAGYADAYESMLSLTVLPAQLAELTGMSTLTLLRLLYPVFLALAVTLVYCAARRRANSGPLMAALVAVSLGAPAFSGQLPAIARQELALLLFACVLALLLARKLPPRRARWAAGILLSALAFTHYSTSYMTVTVLCIVWLVSLVLARAARSTRPRVIVLPVILAALSATVAWNVVITSSAGDLVNDFTRASDPALKGLVRADENVSVIGKWLVAQATQSVPPEEYAHALDVIRPSSFKWLTPADGAEQVVVERSSAPSMVGVVPLPSSVFTLLNILISQLLLVACVIAALWWPLVTFVRRKAPPLSVDMVAFGVAAVVLAAALRLSPTLAQFYNPERAQFQMSLVFAPLVAALFMAPALRRGLLYRLCAVCLVALASVSLFLSLGLFSVLFSGSPPASLAAYGEDAERFIISDQDLASAAFLTENLDLGLESLVQVDRYGRLPLLGFYQSSEIQAFDQIFPTVQDKHAWILASDTNIIQGRARGQVGQLFSTFTFPREFLDSTRAVVQSTDGARVYR